MWYALVGTGKEVIPTVGQYLQNAFLGDGYYIDFTTGKVVQVGNEEKEFDWWEIINDTTKYELGDVFNVENLKDWVNGDKDMLDFLMTWAEVLYDAGKDTTEYKDKK